jgi:thiamine kinase-like enzyme
MDGLDVLRRHGHLPGLAELGMALSDLFGERPTASLRRADSLADASSVLRLNVDVGGMERTLIAKRHRQPAAHRNALAVRRWLPAIGLRQAAPRILTTAADRDGRCVWHVYEDLGERTVAAAPELAVLSATVSLLAAMHTRFERHPLLAECREWGRDLGAAFYRVSVGDSIRCVEALSPTRLDGSRGGLSLKHALLERLWRLRDEEPERTGAITELGGPETFLHGDLWPENVAVVGGGVRLLDWDRAGVGPVGYDVSTLLNRLREEDREAVLELYEHAVAGVGWQLPARPELDYLFVTFELARRASAVLWAALALSEDRHAGWAREELSMAPDWLALDRILAAR